MEYDIDYGSNFIMKYGYWLERE